MHHFLGRYTGLGASNCPWPDAARLVVPTENLANASVAHLQDPGDVTGTGPGVGQLHDLLPCRVWQGTTTDKDASQLVDSTVSCISRGRRDERKFNIIGSFQGLLGTEGVGTGECMR